MPIVYDELMAWRPADVRHSYTTRDTILYALGVGLGAQPTDPHELRFVSERNLLALPTLATVLAWPRTWWADTGQIDVTQVVHGEQSLRIYQPLPAEGDVLAKTRVTGIVDKGKGRGALLYVERSIIDRVSGTLLATMDSTSFARADGGFGGPAGPVRPVHPVPTRPADTTFQMRSLPQAALIYRLSGDLNPLHSDPEVAARAGFKQPILHGLCTFGMASWAIVKLCCEGNPAKLYAIEGRFSGVVYPGETLNTEIWMDRDEVSFRSTVVERQSVVLNNGLAKIRTA